MSKYVFYFLAGIIGVGIILTMMFSLMSEGQASQQAYESLQIKNQLIIGYVSRFQDVLFRTPDAQKFSSESQTELQMMWGHEDFGESVLGVSIPKNYSLGVRNNLLLKMEQDRLYAISDRMVQPTLAYIDLKNILVREEQNKTLYLDI